MRSIRLRAGLAVVLLLGIYLLALLVLAGTAGLVWLSIHDPNAGSLRVTLVAILAAGAILRGIWEGLRRARDDAPGGEQLPRDQQPELWAVVDELAAVVGTRPPDEIRLIPVVNAAVVEDATWLGLGAGPRRMFIGLPLMQAMDVAELRSVLAHELGHYSKRHTALGPLVFRGHAALANILRHVSRHLFVRGLFLGYAKLYFRVTRKVSREQEFEADAAAATIAGRDATISALSRLPAVTAAWSFFLNQYVTPSAKADLTPAGLFAGFAALLAEPQRQAELAEIHPNEREHQSPYDTHPPLAQRVEALRRLPAGEPSTLSSPAASLLADSDQLLLALAHDTVAGSLSTASWDDIAQHIARRNAESVAARLLNAAVSCNPDAPLDTSAVLAALEAGQGPALAATLSSKGTVSERAQLIGWAMQNLVACALSDAGRLRWTVSWSGSPWRVETDVDIADIPAMTVSAITDPGCAGYLAARLEQLGVAPDYTFLDDPRRIYDELRTL
jgi:Zn-dependent protease with chaperone function